jgi:sRNA-binding protein
MTALNSGRLPGGERFTPKKVKPGGKPGFRSNKSSEIHSTRLSNHKKAAELLALLRERHPAIRDCLPLAIGIHWAIGAAYPEFGKAAIRRALKFHTSSRTYLKNLTAGGHRYDLAGQPWGLIIPEHQHYAQAQLTLKEQRDAKCQAPKQTPRPGPTPTPKSHANPVSNTTPVKTGDGADRDAVALRLKGTRPRLTLKRKEGRPQ